MRRNYSRRHSREEMAMIVAEYEKGSLTRAEIAEKYGINSPTSISNWIKKLSSEKELLPLHREYIKEAEKQTDKDMKDKEIKEEYSSKEEEIEVLKAKLAQKERELEWEKKRVHAFEVLIKVAEMNGMPIKKYGAKR